MDGGIKLGKSKLELILKCAEALASPKELCDFLPKDIPLTHHNRWLGHATVLQLKAALAHFQDLQRDNYLLGHTQSAPIYIHDDSVEAAVSRHDNSHDRPSWNNWDMDFEGSYLIKPPILDETSQTVISGPSTTETSRDGLDDQDSSSPDVAVEAATQSPVRLAIGAGSPTQDESALIVENDIHDAAAATQDPVQSNISTGSLTHDESALIAENHTPIAADLLGLLKKLDELDKTQARIDGDRRALEARLHMGIRMLQDRADVIRRNYDRTHANNDREKGVLLAQLQSLSESTSVDVSAAHDEVIHYSKIMTQSERDLEQKQLEVRTQREQVNSNRTLLEEKEAALDALNTKKRSIDERLTEARALKRQCRSVHNITFPDNRLPNHNGHVGPEETASPTSANMLQDYIRPPTGDKASITRQSATWRAEPVKQ